MTTKDQFPEQLKLVLADLSSKKMLSKKSSKQLELSLVVKFTSVLLSLEMLSKVIVEKNPTR